MLASRAALQSTRRSVYISIYIYITIAIYIQREVHVCWSTSMLASGAALQSCAATRRSVYLCIYLSIYIYNYIYHTSMLASSAALQSWAATSRSVSGVWSTELVVENWVAAWLLRDDPLACKKEFSKNERCSAATNSPLWLNSLCSGTWASFD